MRWLKGATKTVSFPKTASVTFTKGDLVILTSGLVATATIQSTAQIGIIRQDIASTDSDFAANTEVLVEVPRESTCELEAEVTNTLLTTDIGTKFDLNSASVVNRSGTTYGVLLCKGFIASNKGRFALNSLSDVNDITWE